MFVFIDIQTPSQVEVKLPPPQMDQTSNSITQRLNTVTQDLISTLKLVSLGPKQLWPQGSKNKEIY